MSISMSPLWVPVDLCDANITVTTQADIDNLRSTLSDTCFNNITITDAQGTLVFVNFTEANGLYVQDSPNLEVLSFPDLFKLSALGVYNSSALSNISLPEVQSVGLLPYGNGGWEVPPPWPGAEDRNLIDVTINNAPALETIDFGFLSGFLNLRVTDADSLSRPPDEGGYWEGVVSMLNSSDTLSLDGCYNLANLNWALFVTIVGRNDCDYLLANLRSVLNLTLVDTAASGLAINPPFMINGSLAVHSLYLPPENSSSYLGGFDYVSSIGYHVNFTSNENVDLSLSEVETLGGDLIASGNTNCIFYFDKMSEITGNISITDNPNSTIPWFPELRRADNIHLRGNVDTSEGPNIFPALTTVPGTVTIEAWNSDFDCSQLVKQARAGIIRNLVCNGTDGTQNGAPSSLSGSAWSGVCVAVGIVVLQAVVTIW